MTQRLKKQYIESIVPKLAEQFKYKNTHEVPKIEKIVINRGIGSASQNQKSVDAALKELGLIAGQKGVITRSKKAISGFKIREEMPVGVAVTLRGERMYGFLAERYLSYWFKKYKKISTLPFIFKDLSDFL